MAYLVKVYDGATRQVTVGKASATLGEAMLAAVAAGRAGGSLGLGWRGFGDRLAA